MDKRILEDYIDACENIKDIEKNIQQLRKRKNTVVRDSVSGSNPNFPYEKMTFKIQGARFNYTDEDRLRAEEAILEEGKAKAEELKLQVEQWMNTIPNRMQRIIRYKIFDGMTWEQVASRIGRNATGEGIRMEYNRFMEK